MHKLTNKLVLVLSLVILSSCREDCLDMELINETTVEMESWYTDEDIISKIATSSISVSDEVLLNHEFNNFGDTIWDDCDNASESSRSLVTYQFFNFPFNLETEFYKQGEEDGFEFKVRYNSSSAQYKFTSQSSSDNNTIELLSNYLLNDIEYQEIFKINFNQSQSDNDIKELFYLKESGIVFIELYNGVTIYLDN